VAPARAAGRRADRPSLQSFTDVLQILDNIAAAALVSLRVVQYSSERKT
jgi:hypothetical protein